MLRDGSKEMDSQGSNDLVLTGSTSHPICHTFIDLTMDVYWLSHSSSLPIPSTVGLGNTYPRPFALNGRESF